MIRKIYTLLILGLCLGFAACSDDNDGLDPNAAAPVIKFPMEQLGCFRLVRSTGNINKKYFQP